MNYTKGGLVYPKCYNLNYCIDNEIVYRLDFVSFLKRKKLYDNKSIIKMYIAMEYDKYIEDILNNEIYTLKKLNAKEIYRLNCALKCLEYNRLKNINNTSEFWWKNDNDENDYIVYLNNLDKLIQLND